MAGDGAGSRNGGKNLRILGRYGPGIVRFLQYRFAVQNRGGFLVFRKSNPKRSFPTDCRRTFGPVPVQGGVFFSFPAAGFCRFFPGQPFFPACRLHGDRAVCTSAFFGIPRSADESLDAVDRCRSAVIGPPDFRCSPDSRNRLYDDSMGALLQNAPQPSPLFRRADSFSGGSGLGEECFPGRRALLRIRPYGTMGT